MSSVDDFGAAFGQTAASFGSVGWHIAALAITFGIMIFGIASGIERVNKIMMPLFFVMFIGLAIYIATLPGASEGYRYLTHPDWSILLDGKVWVYALGQAFFSLSLAGSGTLVYGSYLGKDVDVKFSARNGNSRTGAYNRRSRTYVHIPAECIFTDAGRTYCNDNILPCSYICGTDFSCKSF